MAVNSTTDRDYLLPCGRDLEQVWRRLDAVEAGLADEHEASCAHCAAARESLRALRTATRELIEDPEAPPPDLFGRIMVAVRAEVRRGRTLDLPTPHPGSVQISEESVAVVLRYAADTVPGVRARGCRVRVGESGPDGERVIAVEMSVAVRMGGSGVAELIPVVRDRVRTAAAARVGLRLGRLDLTVADIYDAGEEAR